MDSELKARLNRLYEESEANPDNITTRVASITTEAASYTDDFSWVKRMPRYSRRPDQDKGDREDDVSHSYSLEMASLGVAERFYPDLDANKFRALAFIHDNLEIVAGDVATFGLSPEELAIKEQREKEALAIVLARLARISLTLASDLEEYEKQDCKEARLVRLIDKLMPVAVDITGDGLVVMLEDYGIDNIDDLRENHRQLHSKIRDKFGEEFPELMEAHAFLLSMFEEIFEENSYQLAEVKQAPRGPVETEVKYVVKSLPEDIDLDSMPCKKLCQGYISISSDGSEVRVRSFDDQRFELTVKSGGTIQRGEQTTELTKAMFDDMIQQTRGKIIEKTRYYIPHGKHTIELDVYEGDLQGLITAEVEFDGRTEDAEVKALAFQPPEWFGENVSEDPRYRNHSLATNGMPRPPLKLGAKQL